MTTFTQTISAPSISGNSVSFVTDFDASISGTFTGSVHLERSLDAGAGWFIVHTFVNDEETVIQEAYTALYRIRTDTNFIGTVKFMAGSSGIAAGGTGLTDTQLRALAVPVTVTNQLSTTIIELPAGKQFNINNSLVTQHRGFTVGDTMVPVLSIQFKDGFTLPELAEITEYQIANNNSSTSTVVYIWYEGAVSITGPALPAWIDVGDKLQYRFYTDWYQAQTGHSITPGTAIIRHGGLIVGRNAGSEEPSVPLYGGPTKNMLTLCMSRLDAMGKVDLWVSVNTKELT